MGVAPFIFIIEQQNIDSSQANQKAPKLKYWKFVLGFFGVIVGILILYIAGSLIWQKYDLWRGQKAVEKLAEELKRIEQEDYERTMADTYGGKIPQETLQMYIDVVEKGDVDFYNLSFPDKQLTSQQKEWIIEGSILEDTPPRWFNHFYDLINKVGWSVRKD